MTNSLDLIDHLIVLQRVRADVGDSPVDIDDLMRGLTNMHASLRPAFRDWLDGGGIAATASVRGHSFDTLRQRGLAENGTQCFWWLNLLATDPEGGEALLLILKQPHPFRDQVFVQTPGRVTPKS